MRKFKITVEGQAYAVEVEEVSCDTNIDVQPKVEAPVKSAAPAPAAKAVVGAGEKLVAPMPGTILELKYNNGDTVKKGDVICILEAMKMESEVTSTCDGVIAYAVNKGASVNSGDVIATFQG